MRNLLPLLFVIVSCTEEDSPKTIQEDTAGNSTKEVVTRPIEPVVEFENEPEESAPTKGDPTDKEDAFVGPPSVEPLIEAYRHRDKKLRPLAAKYMGLWAQLDQSDLDPKTKKEWLKLKRLYITDYALEPDNMEERLQEIINERVEIEAKLSSLPPGFKNEKIRSKHLSDLTHVRKRIDEGIAYFEEQVSEMEHRISRIESLLKD